MLFPIPALNDNYIWLYGRENLSVIVIDIPDFKKLFAEIEGKSLNIVAVLLTHNHNDHIAGVAEFKQHFPNVPILGPSECADCGLTQIVNDGKIQVADYEIDVIPTGGHTANHVSYVVDGHLFCGDALFSAGCGRVFTGNYEQMFEGLQRLNQLPDETLVCAGHEYTLGNLTFAKTVIEEENAQTAVQNQLDLVKTLRAENKSSLPTTLGLERQINPFLRVKTLEEFTVLRKAKDTF